MQARHATWAALAALLVALAFWSLVRTGGGERSAHEPEPSASPPSAAAVPSDLAAASALPSSPAGNASGAVSAIGAAAEHADANSAPDSPETPAEHGTVLGLPWTIGGRVVDQTGRGAPGLAVLAYRLDEHGDRMLDTRAIAKGPHRVSLAASAISGDDGRFLLRGLVAGMHALTIAPEDLRGPLFHSVRGDDVRLLSNEAPAVRDVTLEVFRSPTAEEAQHFLVGVVVDESGRPIEHAWVGATAARGGESISRHGWTISDGSFAIGPVEPLEWTLRPTGFGTCAVGSRPEGTRAKLGVEVRLELRTLFRVSGAVIDPDGEPCRSGGIYRRRLQESSTVGSTISDDGSFWFCADEGEYELRVFADPDAYGERSLLVDAAGSYEDLVVRLERCSISFAPPLHAPDLAIWIEHEGRSIRVLHPEAEGAVAETLTIAVPPGPLELIAVVEDAFGATHTWRASATAVAGETTSVPAWGPVEIEEH